MTIHFHRSVEKLKKRILALSAVVEDSVQKSVFAIERLDPEVAKEVYRIDEKIDQMEVEIEEECLKILALYQPVAVDLRFIVAVLKINSDLERIGDYAVNIAGRALSLTKMGELPISFEFQEICSRTVEMLHLSLDALIQMDASIAQTVLMLDDQVDEIDNQIRDLILDAVRKYPEKSDILINYFSASHCFERIADCTTNIAEDVIYMSQGVIVRHGVRQSGLAENGET